MQIDRMIYYVGCIADKMARISRRGFFTLLKIVENRSKRVSESEVTEV